MSRSPNLIYQTSSSTATPFALSTVAGYHDFADYYKTDERFIASFKDANNHYLVAVCHLNSTPAIVVDRVLSSSVGPYALTAPTFSGTVDIVIGSHNNNTYTYRQRQSMVGLGYEEWVTDSKLVKPGADGQQTSGIIEIYPMHLEQCGWFYGFGCYERFGSGSYRIGLYDLDKNAAPNVCVQQSAYTAMSLSGALAILPFNNTLTISSTTNANPVSVTTSGAHGLATGDTVYITDVTTMTEINDRRFTITSTGSTTFTLDNENGSGYSAGAGGTAHLPLFISPGEYAIGVIASASMGTRGASTGEYGGSSFLGMITGGYKAGSIHKTGTPTNPLPDRPTDTGTWTVTSSTISIYGLIQCSGD